MNHGKDCAKVAHVGTGYLHDEADDGPYDVDGVNYCGRCHAALVIDFHVDKPSVTLKQAIRKARGGDPSTKIKGFA